MNDILTIGHSTQPVEEFVRLLQSHDVTALADVRSSPFSRHNPQFNRDALRATLKQVGVKYVFLGKELGARCEDEYCYVGNKVNYARLAQTELFQKGIQRVIEGAALHRIALMCAERDPLDCHRTILVSRELVARDAHVAHILSDGRLEEHSDSMSRLVKRLRLGGSDMFRSYVETVDEAYAIQGDAIAYDRDSRRVTSNFQDKDLQLIRGMS